MHFYLADAFLVAFRTTSRDIYLEDGAPVLDWLDDEINDRFASESLKIVLEELFVDSGRYELKPHDGDPFYAMAKPQTVARFLSHPNCVGGFRKCCLQRFEELVLHQGKHVVFDDEPDEDVQTTGSDTELTKQNRPSRQFHTVRDASKWISKNWPDFALENQDKKSPIDKERGASAAK